MNAYIARQPIFNQRRETVGYELLYRNGESNAARVTNGDAATRKVLTDAVTLFGLEQLTGGRPAYVNFTSNLIMDGFVNRADPKKVVVQVMGNAVMNDRMENTLRELRQADYFLVLKNYLGQTHFRPYLSLFDIIRVNFRSTNSVFQRAAVRRYGNPETVFMADRVESQKEFESARSMGYQLFQGYYFGRPDMLSIPILPLVETSCGKILSALLEISPDVRWEVECAEIIRNDLLLSYLFPREMALLSPPSGATRAKSKQPPDLRAVIYRMGPQWLRRWACLAYLRHNNASGDEHLPLYAYRRGLFMDALAAKSKLNVDVHGGHVFLLGVLSMAEEIVGERPAYLLRGLALPPEVWAALLGGADDNDYAALLRYAELYEAREHDTVFPDIGLSLDKYQIHDAYRACVEETEAAVARMDKPLST